MMSVKILFRCDAANINEIGSGHLIRCITIAKILRKNYKIQNREILFLIKTKNRYALGKKILDKENFNYKIINEKTKDYSSSEYEEIIKYKFKIIIFDRLGNINKNFIKKIKLLNKKIVCFDDKSKNRFHTDLSCNPLVFNHDYNKKNHFAGNEYNIIPSKLFLTKKLKSKKIKKIFLSFGGYDQKKIKNKVISFIKDNINFNFMKIINLNQKKFEKRSNFFKSMIHSDLVICSGGLTMFDSINLNKITIVTSQFKHQIKNILRMKKKGTIIHLKIINQSNLNKALIKLNNTKNLDKINQNMKKYNKLDKMNIIINKIYRLYEN